MKTKDFLGGILDSSSMPQVLNFQGGSFVQMVTVDENQLASYIGSLNKYARLLLSLRINRHSRDASYLASHLEGVDSVNIKKRILLAEFWQKLATIAAPHLKTQI